MITIGYIRVSTPNQVRDGVSLEMQESKIRAYCDQNDMSLSEIITDAGLSGKNVSGRPGVQRLLGHIKSKKVDSVVIYSLSRLGRSTSDLLQIASLLEKNNITLHSLTEKLDTSSAIGKFFFTLISGLSEMERGLISERTKGALSQKRANGLRISGKAEFGYCFDSEGKILEDEHEQAIIERASELSEQGMSVRKIQSQLAADGYFSRNGKMLSLSTLHRIIRKRAA